MEVRIDTDNFWGGLRAGALHCVVVEEIRKRPAFAGLATAASRLCGILEPGGGNRSHGVPAAPPDPDEMTRAYVFPLLKAVVRLEEVSGITGDWANLIKQRLGELNTQRGNGETMEALWQRLNPDRMVDDDTDTQPGTNNYTTDRKADKRGRKRSRHS